MDVEIVLNQNNGLGVREVDIGQVLQDVSVVHGGMAIGDFDVAPAFERCKHHEEVGGAVALVLVIATRRASRLRRDDPALSAMGLENVFFRTRPIVLSLARSTMLSSTTFFPTAARSSARVP